VKGTRRLLTPRGLQAVCRHKRAHCKLLNRQIEDHTAARKPLGGATFTQGANKEPSPTPAAHAGRRIGGKDKTIDEKYALMDAYAKTTFDSDFIHSTWYSPPPFKSAIVQQCALSENSPRLCARRLPHCFAPGSKPYQASTRRALCYAFFCARSKSDPSRSRINRGCSALGNTTFWLHFRQISIFPPLW
jgi:hypothetical protein